MSSIRIALSLAIAASILASPLASADESKKILPGDFSGIASLTSDYVFRGISQSNEHPAAQAGITYKQPIEGNLGFYIGEWGSNVDFNDSGDSHIELDTIGGVTYTTGKWSFDVGGIWYDYPGSHNAVNNFDYNYFEGQATVGYDLGFAALQGSVNASPDFAGSSGWEVYYKGAISVPLPYGFTALGNVGWETIDHNDQAGLPNYLNWGAGLKYTLQGIDLELDYSDTDMHKSECNGQCNSQILFSVSKSF